MTPVTGLILMWLILTAGVLYSAKGYKLSALKPGAKETPGKVVSKQGCKNCNHKYEIKFLFEGKEYFFHTWDAGRLLFKINELEEGQEISVTFDPRNPKNAMRGGLKNNRLLWGGIIIFLGLVTPLITAAVWITTK
ncbi:hypothetical protein Emin_1397 [Elusimicrobium minutum Pei191]|uniref:DUF3592 domain-containing protein n=1 Tax=Elusimicrobium minutum (strain Pei191) TaxID=445932 RepID=B2KEK0_ELUMP|nr:DUF3592 domain-containing protein [Elusimicrobium minutum]ACC98946.1 hypothetical protein Emin_1397 [Elusimicrobium minutum Pei191]